MKPLSKSDTLAAVRSKHPGEPAPRYRVFTRTWWIANRDWPDGREPGAGKKNYHNHPKNLTIAQAREYCQQWNASHDPGPLSLKAEFEEH